MERLRFLRVDPLPYFARAIPKPTAQWAISPARNPSGLGQLTVEAVRTIRLLLMLKLFSRAMEPKRSLGEVINGIELEIRSRSPLESATMSPRQTIASRNGKDLRK